MALFQVSVLKKYLQLQDEKIVDRAYKKFTSYFQHPEIQENIRSSKEEQFQATFLNELFVNVLGYTLNPNPNFNLTTEYKNEKNARKADGAILDKEIAVGVIELKGTNTKHLEGIRQQAFDYKANQKGCVYVITSNFEKLRFYINDATEFLEFDLFELNRQDFSLLWLCLQKNNLLNGLPLKIKEASIIEEEEITKDFYKDYSLFKRELYRDLVKKNAKKLKSLRHPELTSGHSEQSEESEDKELQQEFNRLEKNVKLSLFKKSQKLIDRFLFIFFAEDRGLLPPNSIHKIIADWNKLKDLDAHVPLYERFKLYFSYLDTGRKGTDTKAEIFAYNGGLFKPDAILDMLEIDDELLNKHSSQLAKYDFESQVGVNILGHIFENSLNEIESVNAEIEGADFDKQKSKRKKDGVFYTPKYITKYIVENTVGKLCEEKKSELGFREEEYFKGRKNRHGTTLKDLIKILDDYREWLLQLTICDPACGSGAFLNQALDFLIKEHRYIDEMKAKLLGGGLVFSDIENTILENNIYGVDINEESVEIAKLSLWLRTAQPRRKLNDLSSNIKCGNSLIDDKKVAGNKAFKWEEEFPEVFKNGGFDVVIGNPPYVNLEHIPETSKALATKGYKTYNKRGDLYCIFVERGFQLLKTNGLFSYIMPNKWLQANYGRGLREYFLTKNLLQLIDIGDFQIFQGATTYPCIFIARNQEPSINLAISVLKNAEASDFASNILLVEEHFKQPDFNSDTWVISSKTENELLAKLSSNFKTLDSFLNGEANYGIKFGLTEAFLISNEKAKELTEDDPKAKELIGSVLRGRNLTRYGKPNEKDLDNIILASYGSYKVLPNYSSIYNHLKQYEQKLKKRGQCNGSKANEDKPFTGQHHWLELDNNPSDQYLELYSKPKIMYQTFQVKPCFIYDEQGLFCNNSMWIIPTEDKALLGVLNSKMGWWLIRKYCTQIQNGVQLIWKYFRQLPIPSDLSPGLKGLVEEIIDLTKSRNDLVSKFSTFLSSNFTLEKPSRKLERWPELEFGEFIRELNKAIKKTNKEREKEGLEPVKELTKKDEFEWMELFEEKKKKAVELQLQIDQTDREIDQMVYELYGLTEEEIEIVENS